MCILIISFNVCYSVLALSELTSKADCVLPIENQVHNNEITIGMNYILGSPRHMSYYKEGRNLY